MERLVAHLRLGAKADAEAFLAADPERRQMACRIVQDKAQTLDEAWTLIRHRILDVPVTVAEQTEACYGAALLALHGGPP